MVRLAARSSVIDHDEQPDESDEDDGNPLLNGCQSDTVKYVISLNSIVGDNGNVRTSADFSGLQRHY